MNRPPLADAGISIRYLKKNPSAAIASAEGFPMAILDRSKPAAYLVSAQAWEDLMDRLEDAELVRARHGQTRTGSGLKTYDLDFVESALFRRRCRDRPAARKPYRAQ